MRRPFCESVPPPTHARTRPISQQRTTTHNAAEWDGGESEREGCVPNLPEADARGRRRTAAAGGRGLATARLRISPAARRGEREASDAKNPFPCLTPAPTPRSCARPRPPRLFHHVVEPNCRVNYNYIRMSTLFLFFCFFICKVWRDLFSTDEPGQWHYKLNLVVDLLSAWIRMWKMHKGFRFVTICVKKLMWKIHTAWNRIASETKILVI